MSKGREHNMELPLCGVLSWYKPAYTDRLNVTNRRATYGVFLL
jgi:hypothetical protein